MLKLSGKQFDKPFSGPVSWCPILGQDASFACICSSVFYAFLILQYWVLSMQANVFDGEAAAYDAVMSGEVSSCMMIVLYTCWAMLYSRYIVVLYTCWAMLYSRYIVVLYTCWAM